MTTETLPDRIQDAKDRISDARLHVREYGETIALLGSRAPTLTTALLLVVFGVGGLAGWWAAKPYVRGQVNAEWRARIAESSAAVRHLIEKGNEDGEAVDAEVLKTLGETDAKLATALRELEAARRAPVVDRCTVPADCVRRQ